MLVLTRKKGQRIRIGATVEVIVLEVRGNNVKLGFEAPPEVTIHRDEVLTRLSACKAPTPSAPGRMAALV